MTEPQRTFDDFTQSTISETDSENKEASDDENTTGENVKEDSKLISESSGTQDTSENSTNTEKIEQSDSLPKFDNNISADSGLVFGKDPDEFDIPSKWARRYMAHRCASTLNKKPISEGSIPNFVSILREYANFLHDHDLTVVDARFRAVEAYISYSINLGRRTGYVMQQVFKIKGLYKYLELSEDIDAKISPLEFDQIDKDAIDSYTPPDIEREDLTKDELKQLFDAMSRDRDRLMTILGVETGFRNSDIRGIRLEDINLNEPEVLAHDPKYSKPYTVPISEELALEIEIWMETGRKYLLGQRESNYLFPSEKDRQISSNTGFCTIIRDAAEEADIQTILGMTQYEAKYLKKTTVKRTWHRVIPHALRHSFITLLEKEGVPLEYRMLLANHSNSETTRAYSHGKKEVLKQAQERLDIDY